MKSKNTKVIAYSITAAIAFSGMSMQVHAAKLSDVLPAAGMGLTLSDGSSLQDISDNVISTDSTKDGLSLSVAELNAIMTGSKNKTAGFSAVTASVVKNMLPTAAGINNSQTNDTSEEALAAESTAASSEDKNNKSLAFVKVLQTKVLASAADGMDLGQLLFATKYTDVPDSKLSSSQASAAEGETTQAAGTDSTDVSGSDIKEIQTTQTPAEAAVLAAEAAANGKENFTNLVIAQVDNFVNVRSTPSEDGDVVGKLYNNSVGTFISQQDGWYQITSGSVTGYVKAQYCVTGTAAVELAKKVGTRIATVTTTTLKVRDQATADADVLGLVPEGEELTVSDEKDGWVKVNIEEGDGWVSKDYVSLETEFVQAESKAEEEARLAKEAAERQAAEAALAAKIKKTKAGKSSTSKYNSASSYVAAGEGSSSGNAVAKYALQFVGNPYVFGGTSLTNGTDCSGFVMSVYSSFGVGLPHSSAADRSVGSTVGSLGEAQPGDLICYSGHVALYIGGGRIVHASTSRTGIIVSNAGYRNILAIRRIF